jgi:predicted neuraminidase
MKRFLFVAMAVAEGVAASRGTTLSRDGVVRSEFVFETAPFASAHSSTIVETKQGLVTAWFGGTKEGTDDVGIWSSWQEKGKWTAPVEIANGLQADGRRYPCWSPVLF